MTNLPAPQWLRLSEAIERISKIAEIDDDKARAWLARIMADRLVNYDKQTLFRILTYEKRDRRWHFRARSNWGSEPNINWQRSTIWAPHHKRIIDVDLTIEV